MLKLLKDRSFWVRTVVAAGIILVIVLGAFTNDAWLIKIVYLFAVFMATFEHIAMAWCLEQMSPRMKDMLVRMRFVKILWITWIVLGCSVMSMMVLSRRVVVVVVATTFICDGAAYIFGRILGGRILAGKPFPDISPSKTMEGTIAGVVTAFPTIGIFMWLWPAENEGEDVLLFCLMFAGVIGMWGDLYESSAKRFFEVKNSSDKLVLFSGTFRVLEGALGGAEGHGGYWDRIDSLSFVLCYAGGVNLLMRLMVPDLQ